MVYPHCRPLVAGFDDRTQSACHPTPRFSLDLAVTAPAKAGYVEGRQHQRKRRARPIRYWRRHSGWQAQVKLRADGYPRGHRLMSPCRLLLSVGTAFGTAAVQPDHPGRKLRSQEWQKAAGGFAARAHQLLPVYQSTTPLPTCDLILSGRIPGRARDRKLPRGRVEAIR
jgi:hypothetical protein